jgi:molybdenum cofactor guanylyltransferase
LTNRISGVILAGGANKRYSSITKANIVIGGATIISRIISVLEDLLPEIIIVTNTPEEFGDLEFHKMVKDHYLNVGPLGGIHAGLKSSTQDAIFVFAGDMPFLDKKIIAYQVDEFSKSKYAVLIPRVGKFIEPLHAIYSKSILNELEKFIIEKKSRAVRDFLCEVNVGYLQMNNTRQIKKIFTNINSPSDLNDIIG